MKNEQTPEVDFCNMNLVTTVLNTLETRYGKGAMEELKKYVVDLYEPGRRLGDTVMRVARMQEDLDQTAMIIAYSRKFLLTNGEKDTYNFLKLITMCKNERDSENTLEQISKDIGLFEDIEYATSEIGRRIKRRLKNDSR